MVFIWWSPIETHRVPVSGPVQGAGGCSQKSEMKAKWTMDNSSASRLYEEGEQRSVPQESPWELAQNVEKQQGLECSPQSPESQAQGQNAERGGRSWGGCSRGLGVRWTHSMPCPESIVLYSGDAGGSRCIAQSECQLRAGVQEGCKGVRRPT